jgi:hypothetical protein
LFPVFFGLLVSSREYSNFHLELNNKQTYKLSILELAPVAAHIFCTSRPTSLSSSFWCLLVCVGFNLCFN